MFKSVTWNGYKIRFRKLNNGWNASVPDIATAMGIDVNDRYTLDELDHALEKLELVNADQQRVLDMLNGQSDELTMNLKDFILEFYKV